MSGSRRLLFAEDDPLVRAVMLPVLKDLDFDVTAVESGDEALRILESQSFEVVISDLKMPGASGLDVLKRARDTNEEVRLVAISGYADEDVRLIVTELGGKLLHKPFGVQQLRRVISD